MEQRRAPNILIFMVDQLGAKWLEGACRDVVSTPNIDELRRKGVWFSTAIPSNPICMPSRATLATGRSSRQHGVLTNGYQLREDIPTFMSVLQAGGYRTAAFGKLHFRPHFAGVHPDYRPYGFDEAHITEDARGGEWLDWIRSEHPEHEDSVLATIWPTRVPEFHDYGPKHENLSARIEALRRDFDWTSKDFPDNKPGYYTLPFPDELSQTEWITAKARAFLETVDSEKPFLAQVSYVQPHGPSSPPAAYMNLVQSEKIPSPAEVEWIEDPLAPRCFSTSEGVVRSIPDYWRTRRRYYFADIAHLDRQLGIILGTLRDRELLDDTYVIFLSDHGELLLDHGFTGKGERHYDACIRVPLCIYGPNLASGTTRDEIVQLEDIFPTILEMAGLEAPAIPMSDAYLKERPEQLAGRSLMELARGGVPENWRGCAYVESYNNITTATPLNWARTVRTREWRYTMYPSGGGEQLFDLSSDPDEQHNLAGSPEHASKRLALREELLDRVILQDYPHSPRDLFSLGVH